MLDALGGVVQNALVAFGALVQDPRVALITWALVADVTATAVVLVHSAGTLHRPAGLWSTRRRDAVQRLISRDAGNSHCDHQECD